MLWNCPPEMLHRFEYPFPHVWTAGTETSSRYYFGPRTRPWLEITVCQAQADGCNSKLCVCVCAHVSLCACMYALHGLKMLADHYSIESNCLEARSQVHLWVLELGFLRSHRVPRYWSAESLSTGGEPGWSDSETSNQIWAVLGTGFGTSGNH